MKLKRLLSALVITAMTVGMMSFTALADEAENAPEETGVVETTEPREEETKKGTYKIKVSVMSTGNAEYKASTPQTVTVTIKIK